MKITFQYMNILYGVSRTNKKRMLSYITSCVLPKHVWLLYNTSFFLRMYTWIHDVHSLCNWQQKQKKNLFALNYIITTKLSKHAWLHYTLPSLKNLDFCVPTFKIFTCKYSVSSMGFSCAIQCTLECTLEIYYTFEHILVGVNVGLKVPMVL
jgi:hypothetical protein